MRPERIFQAAAIVLGAAAAYFLWARNDDAAFALAVLGCAAFFLGIRSQIKERNTQRAAGRDAQADAREDGQK